DDDPDLPPRGGIALHAIISKHVKIRALERLTLGWPTVGERSPLLRQAVVGLPVGGGSVRRSSSDREALSPRPRAAGCAPPWATPCAIAAGTGSAGWRARRGALTWRSHKSTRFIDPLSRSVRVKAMRVS